MSAPFTIVSLVVALGIIGIGLCHLGITRTIGAAFPGIQIGGAPTGVLFALARAHLQS